MLLRMTPNLLLFLYLNWNSVGFSKTYWCLSGVSLMIMWWVVAISHLQPVQLWILSPVEWMKGAKRRWFPTRYRN